MFLDIFHYISNVLYFHVGFSDRHQFCFFIRVLSVIKSDDVDGNKMWIEIKQACHLFDNKQLKKPLIRTYLFPYGNQVYWNTWINLWIYIILL